MSLKLTEPVFCFTSDVDWNPDPAIRAQLDLFARYDARLTMFATHRSPLLEDSANIQIGVHPNFLPGSTHGTGVREVLDHVFALYPRAQSFRSHSYFDNQHISEEINRRGIRYDANLCLYMQEEIAPLRHCHGSLRFPTFLDDNIHWFHGGSWRLDDLKRQLLTPGLKIFNFHPYHIALNTPTFEHYQSKRSIFKTLTHEDIEAHRYNGAGPATFVEELLEFLKSRFETHLLGDLYRRYSEGRGEPVREVEGRPAMKGDYATSSEEERKALVRDQYNRMDADNIYITSRDFHLRELEIASIKRHVSTGSILDCGCGNGYTLLSLAKELPSIRMVGVDFSENLIAGANRLKERFEHELVSMPEFRVADIFDYIENDAEMFEFIITERVIVNLPTQALQEKIILGIIRKLKPGGSYLMVEGTLEGFRALNQLRDRAELDVIPDVYPGNESSKKPEERWIREVVRRSGTAEIAAVENFSFYNLVSKIVHPLLVAPEEPKFSAQINRYAAVVQNGISDMGIVMPDVGAGKLFVIRRTA